MEKYAEAALARRTAWLEEGWREAPRPVTRVEVLVAAAAAGTGGGSGSDTPAPAGAAGDAAAAATAVGPSTRRATGPDAVPGWAGVARVSHAIVELLARLEAEAEAEAAAAAEEDGTSGAGVTASPAPLHTVLLRGHAATTPSAASPLATPGGVGADAASAAPPPPAAAAAAAAPAHRPNAFLERLKQPGAADVVESIRSFVRCFLAGHDVPAEYAALRDGEPDYAWAMAADDGTGVPVLDEHGRPVDTPLSSSTRGSSSVRSPPGTPSSRATNADGSVAPPPPPPPLPPQPPHEAVREFLTRTEGVIRAHPLWRGTAGALPPASVSRAANRRGGGRGGGSALPLGPMSGARYRPGYASGSSSSSSSGGGFGGGPSEASERWEAVTDGLEKVVMTKLAGAVFGAHRDAAARDAFLARRLAALSFVGFRHMELPPPPAHLLPGWRLAAGCLRAMGGYPAPGDKLACVMNACRALSAALALAAEARGERSSGVGADDFLPGLILVLIKAAPARLYSSVAYMCDYLRPSKLAGEQGYFLTALGSAVAFLRHVTPSHVGLSPGEFTATARAAAARISAGGGDAPEGSDTDEAWLRGWDPLAPAAAAVAGGGDGGASPGAPAASPPPPLRTDSAPQLALPDDGDDSGGGGSVCADPLDELGGAVADLAAAAAAAGAATGAPLVAPARA